VRVQPAIETCRRGRSFAIDFARPKSGFDPVEVMTKSLAGVPGIGEKVRGPFFSGPNQFAVHFTFDVTRKATGKRGTIEEVGLYTVKDDKITREQFFYDGEH